ncbi:hypothetical protein M409DRAFT_23065 [Zasmidium cellare ATCC 36951]|uniref:SnoaL-like domain-containing protein n=1 Tax=Zasmidium cellare ATCC 36951 TaxID=1080233 RepID=A0A6A6CKE1_ZASCE|nr:uncharacterized protein M409DRAFT_23065 [Zasmidium cellare ATCC 36951]KAF2166422.1 hypothetical protein M409DRAFT_23065 [Zasmidium cellare ATCC 36951]
MADSAEHDCPFPYVGNREEFFHAIEPHTKSGGVFLHDVTNVSVKVQKGEAASSDGAASPWIPQGQTTAAYLEHLTRALAADFKAGSQCLESDLFRKHVHPNLIMTGSPNNIADGAEQYAKGYPTADLAFELHNITAKVHRGTREAEVYFSMREYARSAGENVLIRELCCEAFWQRRVEDGVWQIYRHNLLRGGGDESRSAGV